MNFIPSYHSTEEESEDLVLSTRSDKLGNVYHYVMFKNNDETFSYARFLIYHLLLILFIQTLSNNPLIFK